MLQLLPQPRHGGGELVAPSRRFPEPERNAGRLTMGILYPHRALGYPENSPGGVAQLEDVSLKALDRKVFVDRADEGVLRLENNPIVGVVGDGAARGDGQHASPTAPPDSAVDRIVMNQGRPTSPP